MPTAMHTALPNCTIVIPCFNEAKRLDLPTIVRYAADHEHLLLFVNDGSVDATADILDDLVLADPERLAVLHLPENVGKAEAVRQGILHACESHPHYVGYWDADLATPLETIDEFVTYLDDHPDVELLLGARVRLLGRHIDRRTSRHMLGRLFATAAAATLQLPVYDTQCGAKLLRNSKQTRSLFDEPFLTKWLFDVELLARYLAQQPNASPASASAIHELPLSQWRDVDGSKVKPTDFVRAIWQLARIYRTYSRRIQPSSVVEQGAVAEKSVAAPRPATMEPPTVQHSATPPPSRATEETNPVPQPAERA